jgi:hypothetical protein
MVDAERRRFISDILDFLVEIECLQNASESSVAGLKEKLRGG